MRLDIGSSTYFGWYLRHQLADRTLASRADGDAGAIGTSAYAWDWADRLTEVDLPDTFSVAEPTFAWRADGLLASRTWSTSTAAVVGYDRVRRPVGIDKGASVAFDQAYDRDGNVVSESRGLTGVTGDPGTGTQTFTYDALNRVTGSSGLAQSKSYTYDLDGNRATATEGGTTTTYAYDRTDQLISAGGTAMSYDAFGNLTGNAESVSSVTTMEYDLADRLTKIDAPGGTANDATFSLDALGRFRTRVLAGSTDTYSYAATSETVLRVASSGGTTTDSLVSPSGDRLGLKQGSTLNWLTPDLHGNVAASLDAAEATVVSATRYDAFGETLGSGSGGGTAVGTGLWKYQGRLDVSPAGLATPLYDMSARFYSPGLGAFTQLDSVMGSAQNPLSMNRFLYALANPATMIDPTGHVACMRWMDDICVNHDARVKAKNQALNAHKRTISRIRNTIPNDEFDFRRNGLRRSTRVYSNEEAKGFSRSDIAIYGRDALRDLIGGKLDIATNPGGFYLADAYLARNNARAYAELGGLNPSAFLSGERLLLRREIALRSGSDALGLIDAAWGGDIGIGDFILGGVGGVGAAGVSASALAYNEVRALGGSVRAPGTARASNLSPEQRVSALLGNDPGVASGTETLYRWGSSWESTGRLARKAGEAESVGLPHGVSTSTRPRGYDESAALRADVEKHFPVLKTGRDPFHWTVELPNPVTDAVAEQFNLLFGRSRR